jgi:hypothetical protein
MNMSGGEHPAHIHFSGFLVLEDAGVFPAKLSAWDGGLSKYENN